MTDPGTIKKTGKYRLDTTDALLQTYLHTFHPAEIKQAGMFFTPMPVVRFIVDSIDLILKKYFPFTMETGLANPWVTALDPAAGSFIFPLEVIKRVWQYFQKNGGGRGRGPGQLFKSYLSHQLFAVEIIDKLHLAGHTRLAREFVKMGLDPVMINKANFYLANALAILEDGDIKEKITGISLSTRSEELTGKRNTGYVMVVLGNPPYAKYRLNRTPFIEKLMTLYKEDVRGERNLQPLSIDYIRFIRLAHWLIEQAGRGVCGFIVNNSFLSGLIHRGMRKKLAESFDKIYILNLHGNQLENRETPAIQRDENIFGIKQGAAIAFLIKTGKSTGQEIWYSELRGSVQEKFAYLEKKNFPAIDWQQLKPAPGYYFWVKQDFSREKWTHYRSFISIGELFTVRSNGVKTHRDKLVIAFSKEELLEKLDQLPLHLKKKCTGVNLEEFIIPYHYRPFDIRYICYLPGLIERDRKAVMKNFFRKNTGLCVISRCAGEKLGGYNHILCVDEIIDSRLFYSTCGTAVVFPLFLYPDEREMGKPAKPGKDLCGRITNILPGFLEKLTTAFSGSLSVQVTPFSILYYIYAVLHSNIYREAYREYLEIDYPRIPVTGDGALFKQMAALGEHLIQLHLMKSPVSPEQGQLISRFEGQGENEVDEVFYSRNEKRVIINVGQYFSHIKQEDWEYRIGGYQVLHKWLKDRVSRRLSFEEVQLYTRMVETLKITRNYQVQIDELYPQIERNALKIKI